MKKVSQVQQAGLDKLAALGKPATSQEIGVQVSTMKALENAGLVKQIEHYTKGRECETILWQINSQQ